MIDVVDLVRHRLTVVLCRRVALAQRHCEELGDEADRAAAGGSPRSSWTRRCRPRASAYAEYLEGKYGPGALDGMAQRLGEAAAADGLPLLDLRTLERRPNTFAAHRLLAGALEEGEDEEGELVQQTLQQRLGLDLLAAYWARGEDVGDREVLEGLAEAAGMPAERVVAALDDDLTATAVRLDERAGGQARHPRRPDLRVRPAVRGERRAAVAALAGRRRRRGLSGA